MARGSGGLALRLPFHYGWLIVAVAALMSAVTSSIRLSFGVFLDPWEAQFGWNRGDMALAYSIQFGMMAAMAVVVGWLADRFGAKKCLLVGGLGFAISISLTGTATQLWQLYLYYGFMLGAAMACYITPLHSTTSLWFRKRIGLAVGIVVSFQAVGPVIGAPLFRWMTETVGWERCFYYSGIASLIVLILASFFFQNRPEDINVRPYAEEKLSAAQLAVARAPTVNGTTLLKRAVKTQPFWIHIATHLLGCISHSIPLVFVVSIATAAGIEGVAAAGVLSGISLVSVFSKMLMSIVAEHLGGRRVLLVVLIVQSSAMLMLFGATELWQYYIFALIFGLGYGGEMVVYPMLNRQYYGSAPFASIYGWQMAGASAGMAIGGYVGGRLYEVSGDYLSAIALAIGAGYIGVLAALIMKKPDPLKISRPDPVEPVAPTAQPIAATGAVAPVAAATPEPIAAAGPVQPATALVAGRPTEWAAWVAARRRFESALAVELDGWSRSLADPELAEVIGVAAARARDRSFRLRRAAAPIDTAANGSAVALPEGSAVDRLRHLRTWLGADDLDPIVPPDETAERLLDHLRASLDETRTLIDEQLVRLGAPVATGPVRPVSLAEARPILDGKVYYRAVDRADGSPNVLWIWQWPGSRAQWTDGGARLLVPIDGTGEARNGEPTPVPLTPGVTLEIGADAPIEISATGSSPLVYWLIAADTAALPTDEPIAATAPVAAAPPVNGTARRAATKNGTARATPV